MFTIINKHLGSYSVLIRQFDCNASKFKQPSILHFGKSMFLARNSVQHWLLLIIDQVNHNIDIIAGLFQRGTSFSSATRHHSKPCPLGARTTRARMQRNWFKSWQRLLSIDRCCASCYVDYVFYDFSIVLGKLINERLLLINFSLMFIRYYYSSY